MCAEKQATVEQAQICSVRVGDGLYGIPIRRVLEIVGEARTMVVPLAPKFVAGLVHYRGEVLTTVSLRWLLGLPPRQSAEALLVVESGDGAFGLLVDSVLQVLTASSANLEPNPNTLEAGLQKFFAGVYKLEDRLLILLDPDRLRPAWLADAGEKTCAR